MNPIVERVCQARCIEPEKFFGAAKGAAVVAARQEAIGRLSRAGLGPQEIADQTKLHVQTVYYWLHPSRRDQVRKQSWQTFRVNSLGGPRQTKAQRQEILEAYLSDPAKGTAMACRRGLSPLYAYKLATAMGAIPRKGES